MATIHHQVWISAPPSRVYEAISTADGLGSWWVEHQSVETDGGVVLSHDPGPEHGAVRLKVLETSPEKRVEWECISTHPQSSPASAWTGTHMVFELSERANVVALTGSGSDQDRVTILDFRHSGWDEGNEFFGFCNFAWGSVLQKLQQVCESP